MNPEEWDKVVDWVNARFPKGWGPEQDVAYYEDLEEFDASDVWSAVFTLYDRGTEFAPKGSTIRAAAIDERRASALRERYDNPGLPEPVEKEQDVPGWFGHLYPGETVDGAEHVRRWHRKLGPCGSRYCDIHPLAKQEET